MGKGCLIAGIIGGVGALALIILLIYGVGVANKEARLRNTMKAKQTDNTNEYDNMWKKISQSAQVTDAQKNALKEIFVSHAQARSGGPDNNLLVKWVHESVPNVDTSTFNTLMNIITSSRDGFTMRQKELLDLKREDDNYFTTFPANMVMAVCGRDMMDVTIVTSSRTTEAFKTGKDDDVNVFQKPAGPAEKQ